MGHFELGARLSTYWGILLTFGGVIINNILSNRGGSSYLFPLLRPQPHFLSSEGDNVYSHSANIGYAQILREPVGCGLEA